MKKLFVIALACMLLLSTAAFAASGEASGDASAEPAETAAATTTAAAATVTAAAPEVKEATETEAACYHDFKLEVTKPATCTEYGVETYTCSKCGYSYTQETAPKGHNYIVVTQEATCDQPGMQKAICVDCGDTFAVEGSFTPAKGHTFEEIVVEATETSDGYIHRHCIICDYEENEVIPAIVADASGEASGEAAIETAAAVSNPDYNPDAIDWSMICIIGAAACVVIGAILMLSFGKKKEEPSQDPLD